MGTGVATNGTRSGSLTLGGCMQLGYNTNGFGFHRLEDALKIIAEAGFQTVALTPDVHHLDPFRSTAAEIAAVRRQLDELGLSAVIETGARFLLDPRAKHRPTLLDREASKRIDFTRRCFDLAERLGARIVSAWSGARPVEQEPDEVLFNRLAGRLLPLLEEAQARGLVLAIEPEPGFLVESMTDYERLCSIAGARLPLTLDVGHLQCVETEAPAELILRYAPETVSIQLDDMVRGRHVHLPFGEGEVDFASVFAALKQTGFEGPACVELSDGSRNAVTTCQASMAFLRRFHGA